MADWLEEIIKAITDCFTGLGNAVITFLKNGFVELFCEYTENSQTGARTITGPSAIAYYVFILMGISLVLGLTYYLVNMLRRSR